AAHALVASPYKAAYVAAKHGIAELTKTVALEVAEQGITVNAVCPGDVWKADRRRGRVPAGRGLPTGLLQERCATSSTAPAAAATRGSTSFGARSDSSASLGGGHGRRY